ncbi:MAG: hypothetical protein V7K27_02000 [Nostoc sp.]|uniref:hypothetical protein n=1 Tax=Nostoc sp. TaxID=1180 RepID=UPI002FF80D0E
MSSEQELLTKWRSLDKEKQQEVLDFVKFIHATMVKAQPVTPVNKYQLGKRLRQIRAEIVFSGEQMFTQDDLEK